MRLDIDKGRLMGLIIKETIQVVRDPSSIAIAFIMPLVLLFLFGYGVSMDSDNSDIAIVTEQRGPETQSFIDSFANSRYFRVHLAHDRREVESQLVDGTVKAVVILPRQFSRLSGQGLEPPIQIEIDGVDPNTANLMRGYIEGAWQSWLRQSFKDQGQELKFPVELEPRMWFNPELRSRNFLVPGLISVIITLIGTLLTALVVSREWERGTMEALLATPVSIPELMIGKITPYFTLGMGAMALTVLLGVTLFGVPLRGSVLVLTGVSMVFLLASLAVGLFISTLARTQFVAGMAAIFAAFMPAFMLSGFVFEIASMPWPIRLVTHIVAARYFVPCLQTLFLAGNIWSILWPNVLAMALLAAFFLALTLRKTSNRLD
jgi:ABC-2 type transport system permease protein